MPNDVKLKTELANSYERASRWKDTSDAYANLMAIDSTNLYFTIKKSEAEINRKNYGQAIHDLTLVLQKDSLPNAIKLLGKTYETINKLDSAIYYYNLSWAADSLDSFSASNLVNVLLKTREYKQALRYSVQALEKNPDDKSLNMLHGYAYYALEDYDNAAAELERCFMLGDSSLVVNRSLGISFFYRGDSECAYQYLSRAYQQDTTHAVVMYNLAVSALEVGQVEESIKLHDALLKKIIPSDMQLYLNYRGLALGYDKANEFGQAAYNFKKALDYANTNQRIDVLYQLGDIYENKLSGKLVDKETALNYYGHYRYALLGHISYLKSEQKDTSPEIIEEYESQVPLLDAKLADLEKYIKENRSNKPSLPMTLYILDDEVVDELPKEKNSRTIVAMIPITAQAISTEYQKWIDLAIKQKKEAVIIAKRNKTDSLN